MFHISLRHKLLFGCIFSILAGIITSLGFAPADMWYASLIGLFIFCLTYSRNSKPKHSAFTTWLFFFAMHLCTLSWLTSVMTGFGEMSYSLSLGVLVLFCAYLSLFPALAGYSAHKLCSKLPTVRNLVLFPSFLVLAELINSRLFTGFGWDLLGYTQVDSFISAYAPIIGVQGMTLVMIIIAMGFVYACRRKQAVHAVIPTFLIIIALTMQNYEYIRVGNPVKAALVQGNISTSVHWNQDTIWDEMEIYIHEMRENLDAEIMVWPESAIPDLENNMEKLKVLSMLDYEAKYNNLGLITGIQYYDESEKKFYNSMLGIGVIDRDKEIHYTFGHGNRYYKRHLVPVGEFVPFEWLLRKLGPIFNMPMSSFSRGEREQTNIVVQDLNVASAICYEMVFNNELRDQVKPGTNLIVTVSNDGWFNYTNAPIQHLYIARLRAKEFGKPVLRSTNNGITAVIDHTGEVVGSIPANITATLRAEFRPTFGQTPFSIFGLTFVYLYIGLSLLRAVIAKIRYRNLISNRPSQQI
ncbi:apolipoprotein N-acyltransferase [uncultured Ruminobacter sp.]|uniref:apolipoprotein N-acyltransferase n=1 Tax=uncultured Ruminobacter sp. TaxID=538947 RepID=UPI0025FD0132|nr:apolipoprotein N-acyltransferase [uncultured Ruminobacter sp.]